MRARAATAARLYAERRARDAAMTAYADGFGEPSWDMLLALYVATAAGRSMTQDELIAAATVSPDVARLHLQWLSGQALVRVDAATPATVVLLEAGRRLMDACLDEQAGTDTHRGSVAGAGGG